MTLNSYFTLNSGLRVSVSGDQRANLENIYVKAVYGNRPNWTYPYVIQAREADTLFWRGGMEGWVDLGDWLHTEMVYPPQDGHQPKY